MENRDDIKPKNLSVHDFLARKTAVRTMVPESIVEKILSYEKKSVLQAFKQYSEVEISGFGKFEISQRKLSRRIKRTEEMLSVLYKREDKSDLDWKKIADASEDLVFYKSKVKPNEDRPKRNSGGDQEYVLPSEGSEGNDRTDSQ